ncbi:hypothetical protein Aph02nite_04130 [Actinoplanes philippinensis]|nr:hypothetical protein Aph02nite_04130 [Actinoplanes philippinensis]
MVSDDGAWTSVEDRQFPSLLSGLHTLAGCTQEEDCMKMAFDTALLLHGREAWAAASGYWSPPLCVTPTSLNVNSVWA